MEQKGDVPTKKNDTPVYTKQKDQTKNNRTGETYLLIKVSMSLSLIVSRFAWCAYA